MKKREDKVKKVQEKLDELESIEEEFYDEHEELDYTIEMSEIEEATKEVKMQNINKQIEVIAKYCKKEVK